jgi:hypothetical protein
MEKGKSNHENCYIKNGKKEKWKIKNEKFSKENEKWNEYGLIKNKK